MEGYLLTLLLKPLGDSIGGGQMNRKLFKTQEEALNWVKDQPVPPFALCWYLEAFNEEGSISWSQAADALLEKQNGW